jgi:signal transduction histidine kinase
MNVAGVRRWLGIRGRLILNVLALVALSLWLLGVMLLRQNAAFLAAEQQGRGRAIATAVEKALGPLLGGAPPAPGPRMAAVEELLDSLVQDPSVQAIALCDGSGRAIAASGTGASCRPPGDASAWSYPVQPPGAAPASLTVFFSSRDSGHRAAYAHLQVLVQLVITALILVLFLYLLVSLMVVGPIRRLVAASERIASGNLSQPVDRGRPDELGDLAAAYETMRQRLREGREVDRARIEELRALHADLVAKEAELVRSERLAAVGAVAAGVAHEVGNPLGAVTGYLAMLRGGELSPADAREYLERTDREVARINRILLDLLDYARPPRLDWTDVDLNGLLRDLARHLATQTDFRGVALRLDLADGLPTVRADLHRARQMFLNLALNGAQALAGRGTLTLASFRPESPGRAAGVSVCDDGPGIAPAVLEHLFEPFATAGKGNRGTGLGLAICRRTAQELGAAIEVTTGQGEGTTFTVLFPEAASPDRGETRARAGNEVD